MDTSRLTSGEIGFLFAVSLFLIGLGVWVAVVNWRIVYLGKQGKKTPSIVPLIGGLILALGISRFPFGVVQRFWPVGLIADYGCLPYLVLFFKFLLDERISQMVERD